MKTVFEIGFAARAAVPRWRAVACTALLALLLFVAGAAGSAGGLALVRGW